MITGIHLRNTTGKRSGSFIRYEYGEDLFGYMYLDVIRGKKHRAAKVWTALFNNKIEFLITLDLELERKENLNYTHV